MMLLRRVRHHVFKIQWCKIAQALCYSRRMLLIEYSHIKNISLRKAPQKSLQLV